MPKKPSKDPAAKKASEAQPADAEAPAAETSDAAAPDEEEEAVAEPPQRTKEEEADRAAANVEPPEASTTGASGGMHVGGESDSSQPPPAAAAAAAPGGEAAARASSSTSAPAPSSAGIMLLHQADAAADQHLARFYRELGALIEGEARVLAEDWTFLRHCNAMHAARFTDLVRDAEASLTAIADVKTQCRELPEYFGQIDELDQSLAVLEVAAVKLDQYSRALERRFGLN